MLRVHPASAGSKILCALLLMLSLSASAGPVTGVAVLGDSVADEYRFAKIIEPGGNRTHARNFVETLSRFRQLNFGPFTTDTSRGEPRNEGFAYDWAKEGARSNDLLSAGQ